MSATAWEAIFMLVVLKLPIVYLCAVVWWAVRSEPRPLEGAPRAVCVEPGPRPWSPSRPRGTRPGPHGSPSRRYDRRRAPGRARAR